VFTWSFGDNSTLISTNDSGTDSPQHTYTNYGTFTVILGVTLGSYTGTNSIKVSVGIPLAATISATPVSGPAPLTVQFNGQISGGRTNLGPIDTTDLHSGVITAQGENSGLNGNQEVASNAFDDTTGTKWLDFAANYPSTRQSWIQYQYPNGQACNVRQYAITSANDATTYPARNPANWRLLGSNNGGVSWDTLDTRTNQVFTANFQRLAFGIANANAYNVYRFQIDSVANPVQAVAVQLDEVEFIATPPMYLWSFGDGSSSTFQNPQHTYSANGVYAVSLTVWDGLSYATSITTIRVGQPSLTISVTVSNSVSISWPAWATGYTLYLATNLNPPVVWAPLTNAVNPSGTNFTVTVPISTSSAAQFYQLR
jgi:PKD repeat protein